MNRGSMLTSSVRLVVLTTHTKNKGKLENAKSGGLEALSIYSSLCVVAEGSVALVIDLCNYGSNFE